MGISEVSTAIAISCDITDQTHDIPLVFELILSATRASDSNLTCSHEQLSAYLLAPAQPNVRPTGYLFFPMVSTHVSSAVVTALRGWTVPFAEFPGVRKQERPFRARKHHRSGQRSGSVWNVDTKLDIYLYI